MLIHNNKHLVFADVFGYKAAKIALNIGVDGFKIHSSDILDKKLLQLLDKQNKPILLSCGGSNLVEINEAVKTLKKSRQNNKLALMHGFQSYPTSIEDTNLQWISYFKKLFKLPVGIMDHIDANNNFSIFLPSLAISLGATIVEKHITINRKNKGIDHYSSLEKNEFINMIKYCNYTFNALGKLPINYSKNELLYRNEVKKSSSTKKKF